MAENKSNPKNESRRERVDVSATNADIVAGMAAAGLGLVLASDDAVGHLKTKTDLERRAAESSTLDDPAGAPAADHAANAVAPDHVAESAFRPNEPATTAIATDVFEFNSVDPTHGINHAVDHTFVTDHYESVTGADVASSISDIGAGAPSGSGAALTRLTESVSHGAQDGPDTVGHVVTTTLDQIDATIASAASHITAVGSSIGTTVSNLADTLSGVGQSIASHVADLPSTLLGAQPAMSSVDHVFANAFNSTPIAEVADSIGSFGLPDSLPGFEDFTPINLGFIGQSYTDHIEIGGQTPGGLLHGLI